MTATDPTPPPEQPADAESLTRHETHRRPVFDCPWCPYPDPHQDRVAELIRAAREWARLWDTDEVEAYADAAQVLNAVVEALDQPAEPAPCSNCNGTGVAAHPLVPTTICEDCRGTGAGEPPAEPAPEPDSTVTCVACWAGVHGRCASSAETGMSCDCPCSAEPAAPGPKPQPAPEPTCAPGCDYSVTGYHAKSGGKVLCNQPQPEPAPEPDSGPGWQREQVESALDTLWNELHGVVVDELERVLEVLHVQVPALLANRADAERRVQLRDEALAKSNAAAHAYCDSAARLQAEVVRLRGELATARATDPGPAAPTALDEAAHSVWLHGRWGSLTSHMTTEQREALADAVDRARTRDHAGGPDWLPVGRWWREDASLSTVPPAGTEADHDG